MTNDDVPVCSSCEEGATASYKCRDCSEMLCDPCVRAHQRVRITKEHTIVRFSSEVNNVLANNGSIGSSSLVSKNYFLPSAIIIEYFHDHRINIYFTF